MTKNIQNSTGCNATIIRGSVTGQSISVISNLDNIRRRLQRAMKETGLLNSQDIDRVVEDSLDEEGEEMVADEGSIPVRLVNQAKTEEQKYIEKMKVLDVVDRKEASGQRNTRETKCPGSMGCTGRALRSDSWTGSDEKCSQSCCGGWKEQGPRCNSR